MQQELTEILQGMEKAHKADIQTYSSGHLGPNCITFRPLNYRTHTSKWNKPNHEDMGPGRIRESNKKKANVEETAKALHSCNIRITAEGPRIQKRPTRLNKRFLTADATGDHDMTGVTKLRSEIQEECAVSDTVERGNCVTNLHDARVTRSDRSHPRPCTDTQTMRSKDLTSRKCLRGSEAATRHEHKLQQALRKLPARGGPCRERLTVFSDIFDDVCDGSPAFGAILRDIKTLPTFFGTSSEAGELKKAAMEVFSLEQEARRALEENNRVQIECKDAQDKALVDQKEKKICEPVGQCNEMVYPKVTELSAMAQVEAKRRQVWKVWNEVQKLEKDIRETMVSIVTTGALENCIRDSEDEILNFAASSVFLQRSNKTLVSHTDGVTMFSRCALVLLLCLSTGLAAALIPVASAEELPSTSETAAAEELNVNTATEAEANQTKTASSTTQDPEEDADWGLGSIRGSFQAVNGYFDSLLELMGGRDGVCQYRCRFGKAPQARPGYRLPEPNGCTSSLLGFQFDMGIPAMTKCCNQLDMCYDTCGSNKYRCDTKFRWCLHSICGDLKKSLGFVSKVEACEAFADTMYNTVWTLGCRPFMNSQRAACICEGDEKDEL
ncbi:Group XIIB secretory phospholipase A2-like protein [Bagarius yarrelli]|uniref:Group XIIB secretory phospholipase A2-like protein n=1 Tax=Bagarius yarrelli TaxID=175774 RepID=A0A556U764_BAGYA|nr:Group XIIB secretory phospholipase A2-like protein [Bagarius yarrelli]